MNFHILHNYINLLSIQEYAECGKSTSEWGNLLSMKHLPIFASLALFAEKQFFIWILKKRERENSDNMNIHHQELLRACEWLAQNMCARLGDLMNIYDVIICFHRQDETDRAISCGVNLSENYDFYLSTNIIR